MLLTYELIYNVINITQLQVIFTYKVSCSCNVLRWVPSKVFIDESIGKYLTANIISSYRYVLTLAYHDSVPDTLAYLPYAVADTPVFNAGIKFIHCWRNGPSHSLTDFLLIMQALWVRELTVLAHFNIKYCWCIVINIKFTILGASLLNHGNWEK